MTTLADRFMQAVASGDFRTVVSCLDEDEALVNSEQQPYPRSDSRQTALIVAARKGHADMVSYLILRGSNVNHQDRDLKTALHYAVEEGRGRTVEALLRVGASVGLLSYGGVEALKARAGLSVTPTVTALQSAAKWNAFGHSLAARRAQYEVVCSLFEAWEQQKKAGTAGCTSRQWKAAIREAEETGFWNGRLDLLTAIGIMKTEEIVLRGGNTTAARVIRIHNVVDHRDRDWTDDAPPEEVRSAHERVLGERPEYLSARDARRFTPLHRACLSENTAWLSLLLERGADVEAKAVRGIRPLQLAASMNHSRAIRILLEEGQADADAVDSAGRTALHVAALSNASDAVEALLRSGARSDLKDGDGRTALHVAALSDAADAAEALLRSGAQRDLRDEDGATALDLALKWGHSQTARRMLSGDVVALTQAIERDDAETAENLIRAHPQLLDQRDEHGRVPLQTAVEGGRLRTAGILLDLGAILNDPGFSEDYPLHLAAWAGAPEVVDLFLRHGADPNARDAVGETALYAAFGRLSWNQESPRAADVVRLLLAAGADPSITSFHRSGDLLDFAEEECRGENPSAVELIRHALEGSTRENPLPTVPQDTGAPNEIAEAVRRLDAILADIESNRSNDMQQRFQTAVRDTESRRRYLELYGKKYPGQSEEALVEKILDDLERDNR